MAKAIKKADRRLQARLRDYEQTIKGNKAGLEKSYTRPGSRKGPR